MPGLGKSGTSRISFLSSSKVVSDLRRVRRSTSARRATARKKNSIVARRLHALQLRAPRPAWDLDIKEPRAGRVVPGCRRRRLELCRHPRFEPIRGRPASSRRWSRTSESPLPVRGRIQTTCGLRAFRGAPQLAEDSLVCEVSLFRTSLTTAPSRWSVNGFGIRANPRSTTYF